MEPGVLDALHAFVDEVLDGLAQVVAGTQDEDFPAGEDALAQDSSDEFGADLVLDESGDHGTVVGFALGGAVLVRCLAAQSPVEVDDPDLHGVGVLHVCGVGPGEVGHGVRESVLPVGCARERDAVPGMHDVQVDGDKGGCHDVVGFVEADDAKLAPEVGGVCAAAAAECVGGGDDNVSVADLPRVLVYDPDARGGHELADCGDPLRDDCEAVYDNETLPPDDLAPHEEEHDGLATPRLRAPECDHLLVVHEAGEHVAHEPLLPFVAQRSLESDGGHERLSPARLVQLGLAEPLDEERPGDHHHFRSSLEAGDGFLRPLDSAHERKGPEREHLLDLDLV